MLLDTAIFINQELGKIPCNAISVQIRPNPEPFVDWSSIWSIHIDFVHGGESDTSLLLKLEDVFVCAWLLLTKLVARESQDAETLIFETIVHILELGVVSLGKSSV